MNKDIYLAESIKTINRESYPHIISIGNKCVSSIMLRQLKMYKESYPFDYVPTQPHLITKYLKDNFQSFLPDEKNIRNADNVWFGHFPFAQQYAQTVDTFQRRIKRLYSVLQSTEKILFVYTTEADVYNEMNSRYNNNYNDLIILRDYIKSNYNTSFDILAIHTNKTFNDIDNIINFTINVDDRHLSENMETHIPTTFGPYRSVVREAFKKIII